MAEVVSERDFGTKYRKMGRIGSFLIGRFFERAAELASRARARTVLEIGCGEGFSTAKLSARLSPGTKLAASDVTLDLVRHARSGSPGIPFACESAYRLARQDASFELVLCMEVLEHLDDPARALAELRRVSSRSLLLSVPREPVWRLANLARGHYVRDIGNTPGHVQHWSARAFVSFVERGGLRVVEARRPFPWTMVLAEKT